MKRAWTIACLSLLLLAVPTNTTALFDGIPFSSSVEILAVLGVSILLISRGSREAILRGISNYSTIQQHCFSFCLLMLVLFKVVVYFATPTSGNFEVCYRYFNARSGAPCLRTFEPHPGIAAISSQFRKRSSDVGEINFGPRESYGQGLSNSSWRLPFVNSLNFDRGFWPWNPDDKAIETFPFWAEFRGRVVLDDVDIVQITYLGQGRVLIGGRVIDLDPAYVRAASIQITKLSGAFDLTVDYAFLKTKLVSDDIDSPYAELRVERSLRGGKSLLRPESSDKVKFSNLLSDLSTFALFGWFCWLARKELRYLLAATVLGCICFVISVERFNLQLQGFRFEGEVIFLALAAIALRKSSHRATYLAPPILAVGYGLTIREVEATRGATPQLSDVLVRLRGNDHLVYEGLVREMLNSGFVRGAEDVFYFQPGIRYFFYLLHFLLGESGVLLGIVSMSLIGFGVFYFVDSLPPLSTTFGRIAKFVTFVSLLIWWSASQTIQSSVDGLSEFGTWIILLFLFGSLHRIRNSTMLPLVGMACAIIIWIRPNQGIAMLALLVLVIALRFPHAKGRLREWLLMLLPFVAVASLVPLHNLVFGGRLSFLPNGHLTVEQTSWQTVFRTVSDVSARKFISGQIKGLLYLPSVQPAIFSPRLALAICGFGLVTVIAIATAVASRKKGLRLFFLTLLVIVGQTIPFLKYTLYRYYPIHNIAIYLTMVLGFMSFISSANLISRTADNESNFDVEHSFLTNSSYEAPELELDDAHPRV